MNRTTTVLVGLALMIAAYLSPASVAPGEDAFFDADQYQDGFRGHDIPPVVYASRACDTNPGVRHYDLTVGATAPTWAWTAPVLTGLDLDFDGFIDIANTGAVAVDCFLAPAWLDTTVPPDGILDSQTGPVGAYAPGFMAGELFTAFFAPGVDNDADGDPLCDGANDLNGDGLLDHLYITHDAAGNTASDLVTPVNPSARAFILDDDAPTLALAAPPANAAGWYDGGVGVTVDADDACYLIEYASASVDGVPQGPVEGEAAFIVNVEGDGVHSVEAEAVDYAHNSVAVGPLVLQIDGTAPEVSIESPNLLFGFGGLFLVGDTAVIEAQVDDATSGTDIVEFSDSEVGTFAVIGPGAGNGLHTATWTAPATLGLVTITVTATDVAGNTASDSIDVLVLG